MKKKIISLLLALCIMFTACDQETVTQNSGDSSQEHERVYDILTSEDAADKLLNIFAIPAKINWSGQNSQPLFDCCGTGVFKSMVERLYHADTGENFECDERGYTDIENYIKWGEAYFDFDSVQIAQALKNTSAYDPDTDKVFMSDGLGTVIGVKTIEVVQQGNYYVIDYLINDMSPYYEYGKLTFTVNEYGSFKFISNEYTGRRHTPAYNLNDRKWHPAVATGKDGRYELYYGPKVNLWGTEVQEVILAEKDSTVYKSLGFVNKDKVTDIGFFSNGDVYTMDTIGLNVFDLDMGNSLPVFTTKENFHGGDVDSGPDYRYIYAVRRDPVDFSYIVVYSQGKSIYDKTNPFQLDETYKVGLLDKDGKLTQYWDTGLKVVHNISGFEPVYMMKKGENAIEFFVIQGDEELLRATVDITNGHTDILKNYTPGGEEEQIMLLAEKYVPRLYVTLGDDWSEDNMDGLFVFVRALENLYQMDNGKPMPMVKVPANDWGIPKAAKLSDYMTVAEKYFSWDRETLEAYFRSSSTYESTTDTVIHGDGYGWFMTPEITAVEKAYNGLYRIYYSLVNTEGDTSYENVLTARLVDGEYLQFVSNSTTYLH